MAAHGRQVSLQAFLESNVAAVIEMSPSPTHCRGSAARTRLCAEWRARRAKPLDLVSPETKVT